MSDNLSALSGRKGLEKNLFDELVKAAKDTGTVNEDQLRSLAREFLLGDAITYGTASFYDFLGKTHEGVKVHVCNGSACLVAGTQDPLRQKLSAHFKPEEIGHMCCLGRCHENSAFNYNGHTYSGDAIEGITTWIKKQSSVKDTYTVGGNSEPKILTDQPISISDFASSFKKILLKGKIWALQEIKSSGLRGRGGAGFPMGLKLESCMNTPGEEKYIVCNADEGDPGAYSDRYLLEEQSMLVLFGMMVSGFIVGATRGAVYIRGEYPEAVKIMHDAVKELEAIGLVGQEIDDSGFWFDFKIIEGAGAYICGEETALLSSLEGQRPEVRVRPPYPTQNGLFNKPTIVNNVETQAAVYWILEKGGAAYKKLGPEKSTGTKLVCLDSFFNNPGLYEVKMGTPFSEVIYEMGGGFKSKVKAVHVGGPLGGIVPVHKIEELTLDFESFSKAGFLLGHASVVSIPEDFPIIDYLHHLFEFTAAESCGKCYPCSIGSVRGREMIDHARKGAVNMNRDLLNDLLDTLEIGSLCGLGGGLPLGVRNALEYFEDELKVYFD